MSRPAAGKWGDLATRAGSAAVMIVVGLVCIWQGGMAFRMLAAVAGALMLWELLRMLAPRRRHAAMVVAGLGGLALAMIPEVGLGPALALGAAPAIAVCLVAPDRWRMGLAYAALIVLGTSALVFLRDAMGFFWLMWVVLLIVATDLAGYFAGKTLGGPKFWPSVSPRKTWSGTVAGWGGAAIVGFVFALGSGMTSTVVAASLVLSLAGQMGDIAESAIKRKAGVKDSSALIPGHGGVLDRFDALLAAGAALLVLALVTGFPPGLIGW